MQPEIVLGSAALVATIFVKEKWPITSIDLVLGYYKANNSPLPGSCAAPWIWTFVCFPFTLNRRRR
jgi:hypothetical protein